jgi:hypothetical protein
MRRAHSSDTRRKKRSGPLGFASKRHRSRGLMQDTDLRIIGLTFQVIGIYFLALSIIFKKPKRLVAEVFGVTKKTSLKAVKDYAYKKNQLIIGIFFLLVGYGLQIYGTIPDQALLPGHRGLGVFSGWSFVGVFLFLLACITVVTAVLNVAGLVWSRRTFQRLIVDFVNENRWKFERDVKLAKEIGEIIGVPRNPDWTIEEYIVEVRKALKLDGEKAQVPPVYEGLLPRSRRPL